MILRSDQTWVNILAHGDFDYIVVGSGFTALAFIQKALELDSYVKILCLERGSRYFLLFPLVNSSYTLRVVPSSDALICHRLLASFPLPEPTDSFQNGSGRAFGDISLDPLTQDL